jgi:NADH-quinone oxidoreductase subunit J
MILPALFFYLFAGVCVASAVMVIVSRNPVHSVLYLILAFVNASGLFILIGAEFLAMVLVVVYVGAVAVLCMFVVMMLDVNFAELRSGFQRFLPLGITVGVVLLVELAAVAWGWRFAPAAPEVRFAPAPPPGAIHNTAALGRLIYTDYVFLFQAAGLVLLVAMIAAIVLTHRERKTSRHQSIRLQTARSVAETLTLVPAPLGQGVKALGIYRPIVAEPAEVLADESGSEQVLGHGGHH